MAILRPFSFIFLLTTSVCAFAAPFFWQMDKAVDEIKTRIEDVTELKNWLGGNRCQLSDYYRKVNLNLGANLIADSGVVIADDDTANPRRRIPALDQFRDSAVIIRATKATGTLEVLAYDQTHPRYEGLRTLVGTDGVKFALPSKGKTTVVSLGAEIGGRKRFQLECTPQEVRSDKLPVDRYLAFWQQQITEAYRLRDFVVNNTCTVTVNDKPYLALHPHMIRLNALGDGRPLLVVGNQPSGLGAGPKFQFAVPVSDGLFSIYDYSFKFDLTPVASGKSYVAFSVYEYQDGNRTDSLDDNEVSVPFTLKAGKRKNFRLDCVAAK